jgi:hypothetical protein
MNIENRKLKMLSLYLSGKSLRKIGERFSLTVERVRQIIIVFPEYKKYIEKHGRNIERLPFLFKKCPGCNKIFKTKKRIKIFCNRECQKKKTDRYWINAKRKKCSKCGKMKSINKFYIKKEEGRPDQRSSNCRRCHRDSCYSWMERHPERVKEINRKAMKNYLRRIKKLKKRK